MTNEHSNSDSFGYPYTDTFARIGHFSTLAETSMCERIILFSPTITAYR